MSAPIHGTCSGSTNDAMRPRPRRTSRAWDDFALVAEREQGMTPAEAIYRPACYASGRS